MSPETAYKANQLDKPLSVSVGIIGSHPEVNEKHYRFMLAGLKET